MKIKILARDVVTNGKVYKRGDVVEMRDKDGQPLIDCGAAELYREPAPKKAEG